MKCLNCGIERSMKCHNCGHDLHNSKSLKYASIHGSFLVITNLAGIGLIRSFFSHLRNPLATVWFSVYVMLGITLIGIIGLFITYKPMIKCQNCGNMREEKCQSCGHSLRKQRIYGYAHLVFSFVSCFAGIQFATLLFFHLRNPLSTDLYTIYIMFGLTLVGIMGVLFTRKSKSR